MKHAQKMAIILEHLLQRMETERRLTAPVQLPTLTRLDQDMKQIIESPLPEDQKVLMLDQLLQRYQGLTKQMKMESAIKPTVVLPKPDPLPATETSGKTDESTPAEAPRKRDLNTSQSKSTKMPGKLPATPVTTVQSKIPRRIETMPYISPEEMALPLLLDTPPDSTRKSSNKRNSRTPMVARLRNRKRWEHY